MIGANKNKSSMTDCVDKFCYCFQMIFAMSSLLLATCSWHDRANYLIVILNKLRKQQIFL